MYLLHAPKEHYFSQLKGCLAIRFFFEASWLLQRCRNSWRHCQQHLSFFLVKPWDPGISHGPQSQHLGRRTKHPSNIYQRTWPRTLVLKPWEISSNEWSVRKPGRFFFSKKKWWLLNKIGLIYFVVTPKIGVRWWPHVTFLNGFDSAFFGECSNPWVEVRWGDTSKSMQ